MADTTVPLKRLEFVRTLTASTVYTATDVAGKVYNVAKSYTPKAITPYVTRVEETTIAYSAPVVTVVQDFSDQVLRHVDGHLDAVLGTYDNGKAAVTNQIKNLHGKNAEYYSYAKDTYLKYVEQAVDLVQQQRNSLSASAQYALDALNNTVKSARESTGKNASLLMAKVPEAFDRLLAFPLVAKTLDTAAPAVLLAKDIYFQAHDRVVADPTYKKLYDSGVNVVTKVQSVPLFRKTVEVVYPFVAPVANPAIDLIQKKGLPELVLGHIKPAI